MTLHPASRRLLSSMQAPTGPPTAESIVSERAEARAAALLEPRTGLDAVVDVDADGVPCRLYRPRLGAPVMLYVHGGGWALHDVETHDVFCRHLAHVTGWALLSVDYRRAPEDPWPAPLDDVETAARWLRTHDRAHRVDASWLPGLGDSSGGNLVAGLCVRDPGLLDHQVLLYPAVDRRAALDPALANEALEPVTMEWFWEAYARGEKGDHPEVSVLHAANLAEHPPALVVTCEHDLLRDQAEHHAAALAEAGVAVTALRTLGMVHSFWRRPAEMEAARSLVVAVGALLDAARSAAR